MAQQGTFISKTNGIQDVGIGNQQLDSTAETNSTAGIINAVTSEGFKAASMYADNKAESVAQRIVNDSFRDLENTRASSEDDDFGNDEPVVKGVKEVSAKLGRGVSQGTMTRENARLLVSNSVVKAIEEQPWLSRQIRAAASNLLGFDPKSEGTRQYFASYNTEAELKARANSAKDTKYETAVKNLVSAGYSIEQAREIAGEQLRTEVEIDLLTNKMKKGEVDAEMAFRKASTIDANRANIDVMTRMKQASNDGATFSPTLWREEVRAQENASWLTIENQLMAMPVPPTTTVLARMKAEHTGRYDAYYERVKDLGPDAFTKEAIDSQRLTNELTAYVTSPTLKALEDGFGERAVPDMMALIKAADGDPVKKKALIKLDPRLEDFFTSYGDNRGMANSKVIEALTRLTKIARSPNLGLKDFSNTDAAFYDNFLIPSLEKASPENREKAVKELFDAGLSQRALTVITKNDRSAVTDYEAGVVGKVWEQTKGTTLPRIAEDVRSFVEDATKGNVDFDVVTDTKTGDVSIVAYQGTNLSTGNRRQLLNHPITEKLNNINKYLHMSGRGWGKDLGIKNQAIEAKEWLLKLNEVKEMEQLRLKKARSN